MICAVKDSEGREVAHDLTLDEAVRLREETPTLVIVPGSTHALWYAQACEELPPLRKEMR